MFPATIFDFNGLLVDDEHVHLAAFRDAVAPLGIEITETQYWDELLGYDDVGVFSVLLKRAGLPSGGDEIGRLVEKKKPLYMVRARNDLSAFPGASELVRSRSEIGPVAIVSGALTDEILLGLETLGVRDCVGKVISAEVATRSKPDPQGYLMAIEWLRGLVGEGAERALVFEDSLDGIASAKAARLPTIAVGHSYSREQLEKSPADAVFDRLADVTPRSIDDLFARLYG